MLVLPGGQPGAANLRNDARLQLSAKRCGQRTPLRRHLRRPVVFPPMAS